MPHQNAQETDQDSRWMQNKGGILLNLRSSTMSLSGDKGADGIIKHRETGENLFSNANIPGAIKFKMIGLLKTCYGREAYDPNSLFLCRADKQ